jgi:hypothetical protein
MLKRNRLELVTSIKDLEHSGTIRAVFLALTPLQAVYASVLRKNFKMEKAILIFTPSIISEQNKFYATEMKNEFEDVFFAQHTAQHTLSHSNNIILIWKIRNYLKIKGAYKPLVFVPNIKNNFYRLMIFALAPCRVVSFDDGFGNVYEEYFWSDSEPNMYSQVLTFIEPRLKYANIRKTILNFTMFSTKNAFENSLFTPIFKEEQFITSGALTNVFLLPSYSIRGRISKREEEEFINRCMKKFDIDIFINHPRNGDNYFSFTGMKISSSPYIAESQIQHINQTAKVHVISPPSSVLFTLSTRSNIIKTLIIPNVNVIDNDSMVRYVTLADQAGINVVKI